MMLYAIASLQSCFASLSIFRKKLRTVSFLMYLTAVMCIWGNQQNKELYYITASWVYSICGVLIAKEKSRVSYVVVLVECVIHAAICYYCGTVASACYSALVTAAYVTRWKQIILSLTVSFFTIMISAFLYNGLTIAVETLALFMIFVCNTMLFYYI